MSQTVQVSKACKGNFEESCGCKLWYFAFDLIHLTAFSFP